MTFLLLFVEFCKVFCNHFVSDGVVLQIALDKGFVAWHVDESMTREVEEDNLLLASLLALVGLADGSCDGMGALWSWDDTLRASEEHTSLEGFELWDIDTMHVAVLNQLADNHAGTMIAQTASVDV